MRHLRTLCLSLLLAAGVGCGQPETTISGKITHQGKVPFAGEVLFVDEHGNGKTAILADDGTYTIRSASPGKWGVAVSSPVGKLPAKYSDPKSSYLTV